MKTLLSEKSSLYENLPPNRHFGYLFVAVFFILGSYCLYKGYESKLTAICFGLASVLGLISWLKPSLLMHLNIAWYKLGHLIGLVVTPIVLGIIFYGFFTPVAVLSRLRGRDILNLKQNKHVQSYWVDREYPELKSDSFKKQF